MCFGIARIRQKSAHLPAEVVLADRMLMHAVGDDAEGFEGSGISSIADDVDQFPSKSIVEAVGVPFQTSSSHLFCIKQCSMIRGA